MLNDAKVWSAIPLSYASSSGPTWSDYPHRKVATVQSRGASVTREDLWSRLADVWGQPLNFIGQRAQLP